MMETTLKITAAILTAWAVASPAEAGRWSREGNRVAIPRAVASPAAEPVVAPEPAIPSLPEDHPQYTRELAQVTAMLAKNPDAFGGFNMSNTLDELRDQVDRNIKTRHLRELVNAETPAERSRLRAAHAVFWAGLAKRRELRTKFSDEQNIVHSLMMIFTTKAKLK